MILTGFRATKPLCAALLIFAYFGGLSRLPGAPEAGRDIEPLPKIILPPMFSENMVLQRDHPIPVWGWAPDATPIRVHLADQQADTIASNGQWCVTLKSMKAGGPFTFIVETPGNYHYDTILLSQVLIGEVWVIAGDMSVMSDAMETADAAAVISARGQYPDFRVLMAGYRPASAVTTAQKILLGFWGRPKWENTTYTVPRSSRVDIPGGSSALGYHFGCELYRHFKGGIPIGVIEISALLPLDAWIGDQNPTRAGRAYLANIAPLAPFPVRGGIISVNSVTGKKYDQNIRALVESWRAAWQSPDLPILSAQNPEFITAGSPGVPASHKREIAAQLALQACKIAHGGNNSVADGSPRRQPIQ